MKLKKCAYRLAMSDRSEWERQMIQLARDVYGMAVRDNSREELIKLGMDYENGEPDPSDGEEL